MTPYIALLAALAFVLILSRPFLRTWARRRAAGPGESGRRLSYGWAAVISGVMLVVAVLLVVLD